MIELENGGNLFHNPWVWTINTAGQFLEAMVFFYFIHKFFIPKEGRQEKKGQWIASAVVFTAALAGVDWITNNQIIWYVTVMIGVPFLYTAFFCRGKFYEKLIICITFFSIMISLEHMGILAGDLIDQSPGAALWLGIFFFRRICMKFLMIPIANFLSKNAVKLEGNMSLWYWIMLGGVCLVEDLAAQKTMYFFAESETLSFLDILLPVSWVMIPVVFYSFIHMLMKKNEMQRTNTVQSTYLKLQQQYLNQMAELYESLKKSQHDYKAHLLCMDLLLEAEEYEKAHQYLQKLDHPSRQEIDMVAYTENSSLNLILNQKRRMAQKCGIDFQVEASLSEKGIVEIYDLNMLVMNLCDNAIESAAKVKDGFVNLKIMKKKAYLQIEIQNAVPYNILEKNPDFETSKSKKDLHGMGMKILKNIVEKYDGAYKTDSTDSIFSTMVLLMDEKVS